MTRATQTLRLFCLPLLAATLLLVCAQASPLRDGSIPDGLLYLPHLALSVDKWERVLSPHPDAPLERVVLEDEPEITTDALLRAMGLHVPGEETGRAGPLTRQLRTSGGGGDGTTREITGAKSTIAVTYASSVPAAAQTAFEVGLRAWADVFPSEVVLRAYCGWQALGGSTLAATTVPFFVHGDTPGADKLDDNTVYGAGIAASIQGRDFIHKSEYHLSLVFNAGVAWHYGHEPAPFNKWDLATTAMHEQCHGMFFTGLIDVRERAAEFTAGRDRPARFDRFLVGPSGAGLATSCSADSGKLFASLTNGQLNFDDPKAPGTAFPLYSPRGYQTGSSTYHHDGERLKKYCAAAGISDNECSDLMTPSLPNGYTQRSIGTPVRLMLESLRGDSAGILKDGDCTGPTPAEKSK
jgi:hypothetical protein